MKFPRLFDSFAIIDKHVGTTSMTETSISCIENNISSLYHKNCIVPNKDFSIQYNSIGGKSFYNTSNKNNNHNNNSNNNNKNNNNNNNNKYYNNNNNISSSNTTNNNYINSSIPNRLVISSQNDNFTFNDSFPSQDFFHKVSSKLRSLKLPQSVIRKETGKNMEKPMFITTVKSGTFLEPPPEVAALLGLRTNSIGNSSNSISDRPIVYSFASRPRIVRSNFQSNTPPRNLAMRKESRREKKEAEALEEHRSNGNSEGSLYASGNALEKKASRGNQLETVKPTIISNSDHVQSRQAETRRRAAIRQRAQMRARRHQRMGSPPPVDGRRHEHMQTEQYFEEVRGPLFEQPYRYYSSNSSPPDRLQLTERPSEKSASCQANLTTDVGAPLVFPRSEDRTSDVATQIYADDLPAENDENIHSLVGSIINKILRTAILEINEEIEKFHFYSYKRKLQSSDERENSRRHESAVIISIDELSILIRSAIQKLRNDDEIDIHLDDGPSLEEIKSSKILQIIVKEIEIIVKDVKFISEIVKSRIQTWIDNDELDVQNLGFKLSSTRNEQFLQTGISDEDFDNSSTDKISDAVISETDKTEVETREDLQENLNPPPSIEPENKYEFLDVHKSETSDIHKTELNVETNDRFFDRVTRTRRGIKNVEENLKTAHDTYTDNSETKINLSEENFTRILDRHDSNLEESSKNRSELINDEKSSNQSISDKNFDDNALISIPVDSQEKEKDKILLIETENIDNRMEEETDRELAEEVNIVEENQNKLSNEPLKQAENSAVEQNENIEIFDTESDGNLKSDSFSREITAEKDEFSINDIPNPVDDLNNTEVENLKDELLEDRVGENISSKSKDIYNISGESKDIYNQETQNLESKTEGISSNEKSINSPAIAELQSSTTENHFASENVSEEKRIEEESEEERKSNTNLYQIKKKASFDVNENLGGTTENSKESVVSMEQVSAIENAAENLESNVFEQESQEISFSESGSNLEENKTNSSIVYEISPTEESSETNEIISTTQQVRLDSKLYKTSDTNNDSELKMKRESSETSENTSPRATSNLENLNGVDHKTQLAENEIARNQEENNETINASEQNLSTVVSTEALSMPIYQMNQEKETRTSDISSSSSKLEVIDNLTSKTENIEMVQVDDNEVLSKEQLSEVDGNGNDQEETRPANISIVESEIITDDKTSQNSSSNTSVSEINSVTIQNTDTEISTNELLPENDCNVNDQEEARLADISAVESEIITDIKSQNSKKNTPITETNSVVVQNTAENEILTKELLSNVDNVQENTKTADINVVESEIITNTKSQDSSSNIPITETNSVKVQNTDTEILTKELLPENDGNVNDQEETRTADISTVESEIITDIKSQNLNNTPITETNLVEAQNTDNEILTRELLSDVDNVNVQEETKASDISIVESEITKLQDSSKNPLISGTHSILVRNANTEKTDFETEQSSQKITQATLENITPESINLTEFTNVDFLTPTNTDSQNIFEESETKIVKIQSPDESESATKQQSTNTEFNDETDSEFEIEGTRVIEETYTETTKTYKHISIHETTREIIEYSADGISTNEDLFENNSSKESPNVSKESSRASSISDTITNENNTQIKTIKTVRLSTKEKEDTEVQNQKARNIVLVQNGNITMQET